MKATRINASTYRIGDEHGDFIDDEPHPMEIFADILRSDAAIRKAKERARKAKDVSNDKEHGQRAKSPYNGIGSF